jgi:hypothetical protein
VGTYRKDGQDRAPPGLWPPRMATNPVYPDRERVTGIYFPTSRSMPDIADNALAGIPAIAPDDLAQTYWNLHTRRDHAEIVLPA